MSSLPYRLRLPGPTPVPEKVREAISQPVVNHRGPEFRAIYGEVQRLAKPVFGTESQIIALACSGTGAMEAALVNVQAPGERMLVAVNGQFSERFAAIGRALGAEVDVVEIPWGRAVNADDIERRLSIADYRAVVVVHNESSTAITTPLQPIGALLRDRETLFIADSVSGLAGTDVRQDDWGVDVVVTASQKALMCPPGAALVSISEKARKVIELDTRSPRFYFDFRKALSANEKSETPFTAPVAHIAGLNAALEMIHAEGLPAVLERHKRLSRALREGCSAIGLPGYGNPTAQSPTVVAVEVPQNLNGADIVRLLYERHRTVIAGARNKLARKIIRFGTMGHIHEGDILTDLEHLEDVLASLGHKFNRGDAVAAASAMLGNS